MFGVVEILFNDVLNKVMVNIFSFLYVFGVVFILFNIGIGVNNFLSGYGANARKKCNGNCGN